MRDAQNLKDLLLIREDKAYKILGVYLTESYETYVKVKGVGESITINYAYPNFNTFISNNNFTVAA